MNPDAFDSTISELWRKLSPDSGNSLNADFSRNSVSMEMGTKAVEVNDVARIFRCYRIAAKLAALDHHTGDGPYRPETVSNMSELAVMLLMSGESVATVSAGILQAVPERFRSDGRLIERIAGPEVREMLSLLDAALINPELLATAPPSVASLHCGITLLKPAEKQREQELQLLQRMYSLSGVPEILQSQFLLENSNSPLTCDCELIENVLRVRNALRVTAFLYSGIDRSWGPYERLPLMVHAVEAGMLPLLSGAKTEVVVAAICHDMLEHYVTAVDQEFIEQKLQLLFGGRVLELISGVTEPPKQKDESGKEPIENWYHRKETVLDRLLSGDNDLATLSCATKISTIAAGNKTLSCGHPFASWSSGSVEDNLSMFARYGEAYEIHNVAPLLQELYHEELSRLLVQLQRLGEL